MAALSNYIQSVLDATRGRPRSTEWYKDKIKEFGKPGALDLIRDGKRANAPFYGRLNMFFYDPKHKRSYIIMTHFLLYYLLIDTLMDF